MALLSAQTGHLALLCCAEDDCTDCAGDRREEEEGAHAMRTWGKAKARRGATEPPAANSTWRWRTQSGSDDHRASRSRSPSSSGGSGGPGGGGGGGGMGVGGMGGGGGGMGGGSLESKKDLLRIILIESPDGQ